MRCLWLTALAWPCLAACVNLDALEGDAGTGGGAREASADASHEASSDAGGKDAVAEDGGPSVGGGDGGASDGVVDGPADSPAARSCPMVKPALLSKCSAPGLQCEYPSTDAGIQNDIGCSTIVQCDGSLWKHAGFSLTCQLDSDNPALCPGPGSTGGICSKSMLCNYPTKICYCTSASGGGPVTDGGSLEWVCEPGPGCPMPRPALGSKCSGTPTCSYAPCLYNEVCLGGLWQASGVVCP